MKGKKFLSLLLSAAMVVGLVGVNAGSVSAAEDANLALNKTATQSSYEAAETNFQASQAVDGDLTTRWGTGQNAAANEWMEVALGSVATVNKIKIHFERSDADQNIKDYKIEAYADGAYATVYEYDETAGKAKQVEEITFETAVTAEKIKLTILDADGGTINWINVGVSEIEVYGQAGEEVTPPPTQPTEPSVNLALNKTAKADSSEASTLGASKAVDGDTESMSSRWASAVDNAGGAHWVSVDLGQTETIKTVRIFWELRKATAYKIQVSDDENSWTDAKVISSRPAALKDTIVLDNPVEARYVRLYIDSFTAEDPDGGTTWATVSIFEMEVYSGDPPAEPVNPIDAITVETPEKGDTKLVVTIPEAEGFTAIYNGTDFEQIVSDDLTIAQPLVDKTVKVSFKITKESTGSYEFKEVDVVIPGTYTATVEGKNEKPVIIPEIAEWYSDSTEKLAVSAVTKVVYSDASLETVVDEFIADYADFTGITLTKKQGAAEAGAFNFVKEAPDALLGEEGYTMDIQADRIVVKSEAVTGNMYGMQTILQMYKQDAEGFAVGQMRDYPKFEIRGLLLDVARKPISMEMIEYIGRTMRYYKMNDYQIHLSDNLIFLEDYMEDGQNSDQSIALEKAYEAFRLECDVTNAEGESPTAEDYYFTKDEFRAYIQEQRELGMNIVPELDFPAHSNSFTKVWPELAVQNGWGNRLNNPNRPLIDHLDISKAETVLKIKQIFDDYTQGENPVFDEYTTVHAGADEFVANYNAYRNYFNEIVPYVKQSNQVRIWGGLTWITHEPGQPLVEISQDAIEGVQMNLWSSGWASGPEMYEMGYDLINTIDSYGYMVPNGGMGRGAYGDLLNVNSVFSSFMPNKVAGGGGWKTIPAGDPQVKGAVFAIWSDNIDTRACGLSESDYYWRFFDALPFYAEKTWAATGQEKGTASALAELAQEQGIGPNVNPYYEEDKVGTSYAEYDFAGGLADTTANDRDLTAGKNAAVENGALELAGGESYVTSPIDRLGNDNELSFDITLEKPAKAGDIIFEADAAYGTHDIRVMEDGRLGFTRELYSYYFDYKLPVGVKVNIKITTAQQDTLLYVDDELIGEAEGKFIHNDMVKKDGINHSTFALPLERIGSKTNAIEATIDNVVVAATAEVEEVDVYNKAAWTGTTDTETIYTETEGELEFAFDNNAGTIWHSNWQGATDKLTGSNTFYAEIDFGQKYTINQFSFTPRTDGNASGQVTKADLYVKANASDEWTKVAEDQTFAANANKKTFAFTEQEVQFVKFVAKDSNDGWVAVSEFDIANKPVRGSVVYVEAQTGGTVTGGAETKDGEEVTVTAIVAEGYTFAGWYNAVTGEKLSDELAYTFTVSGNTALEARFEADEVETPVTKVDLMVAIGNASAYEAADYTEESYAALTAAIASAGVVFNDEDATSEEIAEAIAAIETAIAGLEEKQECTHETTEAVGEAKVATCTETGLTAGEKCSACGEVLKEQEVIEKLPHTEEAVAAVAPTCTETGLTAGKRCSVCETVTVPQEEVAALGHEMSAWAVEKAPTYEEDGVEERHCVRNCGEKETRKIDKLVKPVDPDKPVDPKPEKPASPVVTPEEPKDDSVALTWAAVEGAVKYNVLVNGKVVATVSAEEALAYTVKELEAGKEYKISVEAVDANGNASEATEITVEIEAESQPSSPVTGDTASFGMMIFMMAACAAICAVVMKRRRTF